LNSYGLLYKPATKDISFFEFGCSEGILLYELSKLGYDVLGEDVCAITEQSQKVYGITILNDPIETLQVKDKFDVVMSFHVMEHLVNPRYVLEKVSKFVKPDGRIFLHIPIDDKELSNPDHYHFFCPLSMTYLMSRHTKIERFDIQYYRRANGDINAVGSIIGRIK
jgi:SAM-dependent methyltransferase